MEAGTNQQLAKQGTITVITPSTDVKAVMAALTSVCGHKGSLSHLFTSLPITVQKKNAQIVLLLLFEAGKIFCFCACDLTSWAQKGVTLSSQTSSFSCSIM